MMGLGFWMLMDRRDCPTGMERTDDAVGVGSTTVPQFSKQATLVG
jgi:hypothetical protein